MHHNIPGSYLILKQDQNVFLARRMNTGFEDGNYGIIAGHVDPGETFTEGLIRETKEEAGIRVKAEDLSVVHLMHRRSTDGSERVDVFFITKKWEGEPQIREADKCDDIGWFPLDDLPKNTIDYIRVALEHVNNNVFYSEFGWPCPSEL